MATKKEQIKTAKAILADIERRLKGDWIEDWQIPILKERQKKMKAQIKKLEKGS